MQYHAARKNGFTLVELLIVVVVITILAVISIVAYSGMQTRARDTIRASDMAQIEKSLRLYETEHNGSPKTSTYSEANSSGWDVSSVNGFMTFLNGQLGGPAPVDPLNTLSGDPGGAVSTGYGYFYYCYQTASPYVRLGYFTEANGRQKVLRTVPVVSCL